MPLNKLTGGNEGCLDRSAREIINHNMADMSVASATFTATSGDTAATLTNVVGLVSSPLPIGQYMFEIDLGCVCTTNGGIAVALKQGAGLTLSQIEYKVHLKAAASMAFSRGTTTTDQTKMANSTAAAWLGCVITGSFTVSVTDSTTGTLQVQAAQSTSHADATSVYLGSTMKIRRCGVTG